MALYNMSDMLRHAYQNGYAIGAFDLVSLDFLQGIMEACEQQQAPVILSLAESHFEAFDFELIMPAVVKAAERATVPVAIHLDHGTSLDTAVKAINLGCNGVMIDASEHSLEKNIHITQAMTEIAKKCGICVEGELGYVPGVEGEDARQHPGEIRYTTVEDAQTFVAQTRVDALAVSIGTVHGKMRGVPELDFERLQAINETLNMPLVLHGGTGLDDSQYQQLVANGIAKINYFTALSDAAAKTLNTNYNNDNNASYMALAKGIREAIADEVKRCNNLWGSAGQAQSLMQAAQAWQAVHHLIIYNTEGVTEAEVDKVMAEGREVLSAIPGVLAVETGRALIDAAYQYCWVIRFCHPNVIDSYKHHPDHVAFADKLFRPIAGDRISIDYLDIR